MQLPNFFPSFKQLLKSFYILVTSLKFIPFPSFKKSLLFVQILIFLTTVVFTLLYVVILRDLPSPNSLATRSIPQTTHIKDRNGTELYKIYSSQNRTLIKLSDLPPFVPQAVLAIEDKDFYVHNGFSLRGTLRAAWKVITGTRLEGGSTITQQLVKTTLLTPERTYVRKIKELLLAYAVELKFTKDEILEMYLNHISFGGQAYGIEEAAQTFFGVSARELSLSQATLLAGLPAAPSSFSPYGPHPQSAKNRQQEVLRQMATSGYISWDQASLVSAEALTFRPPAADISAPHFVMYVKELLTQKYGPALVEQGGLEVITSLDLDLHNQVQKIVEEETAKIRYLNIHNGAALVTHPPTGEILAMVGSRDYFDLTNDGAVNVTLRPRQPGSSIKPINYALSFSKGLSPASSIEDSPITFNIAGQPPYTPVNYDRAYHGRMSLRTALGSSYNIPAVKLLAANGVHSMIDLGKKMGISTWEDPDRFGLSLTLGGGEVTMTDMATAYGVFANAGSRVNLNPILKVLDSTGRILEDNTIPPSTEAVLDPYIAFLISDILSDNAARTPTFGSSSKLYIPGSRVAVKTGTTNNLRDNWTIGYTPDTLVVVWVGNNNNSPMSYVASGVTGASPIWRRITDLTLKSHPFTAFTPPEGLARLPICGGRSDYFLPGTTPPPCPTPHITPQPQANLDPRILTGLSTNKPSSKLTPKPTRIPRFRR